MSNDALYQNFLKRYQEVMIVPPQTVGPLTPVYKKAIPFFKTAPWRVLVPLAILLVTAGVLVSSNFTAIQIASFLQKGF